jgi:hypothetical protein
MRIGVFAVLSIFAIGCTSGRVLHDSDGNSYTVKVMSDGTNVDHHKSPSRSAWFLLPR